MKRNDNIWITRRSKVLSRLEQNISRFTTTKASDFELVYSFHILKLTVYGLPCLQHDATANYKSD